MIPWGFGKWWFHRGALVEKVVCRSERPGICLGDNAGRPEIAGRPRLFREAEERGIPVLRGSDPLPMPEQVDRAGSYGFLLEEGFDAGRPAESLRRALRALSSPPRTFGRLRELGPFLPASAPCGSATRHRPRPGARGAPVERTAAVYSPWTR